MSKQIDQRVVQMQFDNAQFERNVSTTMSTIEKLKQKLNFTGTAKGLENVNSAAKKVDMSGLSNGVGAVQAKFSALEVMGVTALANITNSAVNAGKRIVSALTIDPIKTGFQEYETQINATQTILANTRSKGSTIDDVNKALEELNKYADLTIYNFTEMTRNIGTFTAAGIDLDTSVNAIQGIANLAAVSGSTSQQASTAMYQLSQALAAGTVKLMDWNSVVNAGMGGEMFQNALKETSELLGTGAEAAIKAEGSFRESLRTGWLTSEVLTETLKTFTSSGAVEKVAEYTGLTKDAVQAALDSAEAQYGEADAIKYASKALAEKSGKSSEEIQNTLEFAKNAQDAATKVKTFTQLWDVLKESAQSGWAQTWKILVGDFEEAKSLLTPLADYLTAFISKMSDFRNTLLEKALDNPFADLLEKINNVTGATEEMVGAVKNYGEVVDKVLGGEFGTGQARWDKLTEAGYDWAKVQNMVNEKLGSSVRHTEKLNEAQQSANETQNQTIEQLLKKTDAQLKTIGFTEKEIEALRELETQSEKTGIPIDELIKDMDKLSGRSLLINSFKNAGQGLVSVLKALKDAWVNAFPPMTSDQLYNIIAGLHKFSTKLVVSKDTAEKLERTFKGVFAIIDIVTTLVGGGAKIAFKVLTQILGMFDMDVLDLTANIGDAIVKFRDWIDSALDFTAVFEKIAPYVTKAGDSIKDFIASVKGSDELKTFKQLLLTIKEALQSWGSGIKDAENVPRYIIEGLINGLRSGVKMVWDATLEIGKSIWDSFCSFFDMHSPSKKMEEGGENIVAGVANGIKNGAKVLWDAIQEMASNIFTWIKGIDFGKVLALGLGAGMLITANKLIDTIKTLASPLEGLGQMFEGMGDMFEGIGKNFKAKAWEHRANALKSMAIAVGILAASVFLLVQVDDPGALWNAVGAIAALTVLVGGILLLTSKLDKVGDTTKAALTMVGIAGAVMIMVMAMKKMSGIENMGKAVGAVATMVLSLMALTYAIGKFINPKNSVDLEQAGKMMLKMSKALLAMVLVIKLASMLDGNDIIKGTGVVALVGGMFAAIIAVSKLAGNNADKVGGMLLKMSIALIVMVGVIKLAAGLDGDEILKGIAVIGLVELLFAGIIYVSKFAGANASKAGTMMLLMSGALLIMVQVIKQVGELDDATIERGIKVIAKIEILFAAIIAVSKFAGENAVKAGTMLLLMSGAMIILTGVLFVLSKIDPDGLKRALGAVTVLGLIFMGLIAITKLMPTGKDVALTGPLIALTVAVTLMAAAIVALSLLDPSDLRRATTALTMVIGTFALVVAATKNIKGVKTLNMLPILLVVGGLAGVIALMCQFKTDSAIQNAAALSILLLSLSGSMALIKDMKLSAKDVGVVALMGLVVAELAIILGTMAYLDVEASLKTTAALSILLLTMAGALLILNGVTVNAEKSVGVMAIMGLVVGELAIILGIMSYMNVEPSIETAAALSILVLALSEACVILAKLGTGGAMSIKAAATGATALVVVVGILGALAVAVGGLMNLLTDSQMDAIETGLDRFIVIMEKLGRSIGAIVGGFIGGIGEGVMSSLPAMADHLSDFMENLDGFIEGAKNIDSDAMDGVRTLAGVLLMLTGGAILESLTAWATGGSSLVSFGEEIAAFAPYLKQFSEDIAGVDSEAVTAAANAAKALAVMADTVPNAGGVAAWFAGENSLATFGPEIAAFGPYLKSFATSVAGIDAEAVKNAAAAGTAVAEMADKVPNQGGVAAWFAGENSLASFGPQLYAFGYYLAAFSYIAASIDSEAVKKAAEAGTAVAEMADTVPNEGGVAAWFAGENSLASFGPQLTSFGSCLAAYSQYAATVDCDAVKKSAKAASALVEMTNHIPNEGGVAAWFAGDNSVAAFGEQLVSFGLDFSSYASYMKTVDTKVVSATTAAAESIVKLASTIPEDKIFKNETTLDEFGAQLVSFGLDFSSYYSYIGGMDASKLASTTTSLGKLVEFAAGLADKDFSGLETFGEKLAEAGDLGVSEFVDAFEDAKDDITASAGKMMDSFVKGVMDHVASVASAFSSVLNEGAKALMTGAVKFVSCGMMAAVQFSSGIMSGTPIAITAAKTMATGAAEGTAGMYNTFYSHGESLAQGFADGISSKAYLPKARAKAMAKAAAEAAAAELDINSPSRVLMKIGSSIPEGFAIGIDKLGNMVKTSASNMSNTALNGVSKAVHRITDMVNMDIDTQPTIRPVLDLSEVKSGASVLSGLFNSTVPIAAYATAGTIGTIARRNSQNGDNADVVSAIDKLRGEFKDYDRATYNINGVTYDDGSNLRDAVETIVRYANIERRK